MDYLSTPAACMYTVYLHDQRQPSIHRSKRYYLVYELLYSLLRNTEHCKLINCAWKYNTVSTVDQIAYLQLVSRSKLSKPDNRRGTPCHGDIRPDRNASMSNSVLHDRHSLGRQAG